MKKIKVKKFVGIFFLMLMLLMSSPQASAQCPMCKSSAESAMKEDGNTKGLGLNNAILYLLTIPYLLVGTVGYVWYKRSKRDEENQQIKRTSSN